MMERHEKLDYIKVHDPEASERLTRLLDKRAFVTERNVYGERFTERQFNLVFEPLLSAAFNRARILELLSGKEMTVAALAGSLSLEEHEVFGYLKDLLKKNQVEIMAFDERRPVFRKR